MVKMKEEINGKSKSQILRIFRVDARELISVRSRKMEFFSELDWVQLFSPNIDLLGAAATAMRNPPNEPEIATEHVLNHDLFE